MASSNRRRERRPAQALPVDQGEPSAVIASIVIALALLTVAVYAQVSGFGFLTYDDNDTIYQNEHVQQGLSVESARWALTSFDHANWIPLTRLSHLIDVELWGLDAGGHHVTNLVLHVLSVLALFGCLYSSTGALWRSALVAAVFAIHPQHVESVAWVTERKDVLSMLLGLGAFAAWGWWVRKGGVARYMVALVAFAASLSAKPMFVTFPFALLLLDWWPLERLNRHTALVRILEKLPLFALSIASSIVTLAAQGSVGAIESLERLPLGSRLANAAYAAASYLGSMFWPAKLAVYYPRDPGLSSLVIAWSVVVLGLVTIVALVYSRKVRPVVVGWFWYLGTLVPVIGIVQVGSQAMADRYTYLPSIGALVALVWGGTALAEHFRLPRKLLMACSVVLIAVLAIACHRQVSYWRDSVSLFEHTIAVTGPNAVAESNLGVAYVERGDHEAAIPHFQRAVEIRPEYVQAQINLANAMARTGRLEQAAIEYQRAISIDPEQVDVHNNLGVTLARLGRFAEAEASFAEAVRIDPKFVPGIVNLAKAAMARRQNDVAMGHLNRALALEPANEEAIRMREKIAP